MKYFLPIIFAIVNRVRGSDLKLFGIPIYSLVKNIFPLLLAGIIITKIDYIQTDILKYVMLCFFSYRLGESMGWGKWIGSITERSPKYDDDEGKTVGIHWVANFFIKERKDYLNYSRLALFIRGIYWWLPVLLVFLYAGVISIAQLVISSFILGAYFPLSVEIGRILPFKFTSLIQTDWEIAEFIYGLMQGITFTILFF